MEMSACVKVSCSMYACVLLCKQGNNKPGMHFQYVVLVCVYNAGLTKSDPDYEWVCEELARLGYLKPGQDSPSPWFFADMHDAVGSGWVWHSKS